MKLSLSLEAKLLLFCVGAVILGSILSLYLYLTLSSLLITAVLSACILFPLLVLLVRLHMNNTQKTIDALLNGFDNFLDGDFSVSIANLRSDDLGKIVDKYNQTGEALRRERNHLYQRELLLDTVIQATPVCLLLVDDKNFIIYSNNSARQLFHHGKAINGLLFDELINQQADEFKQAVDSGLDGLFSVKVNDVDETFHLTQNTFSLNTRHHTLYLFKSLTTEMNRKEVQTWKKVIRIISHELNNSLAPISSLAHSGQLICQRGQTEKLESLLSTIADSAEQLHGFIEGYAKFARLPKPLIKQVDAKEFFENLQRIEAFELDYHLSESWVYFDPRQIQQTMINLVKNSFEAGSPRESIVVKVTQAEESLSIQILDRGKGMSENNLSQALLPFYSTKQNGTGLGLPLCREIIEAHGGKFMIAQRAKGGISVSIRLPNVTQQPL